MAPWSFSHWVYDVFVSFYGEDVRKTFLSRFLKKLDRKLITSFKDGEIVRSHSIAQECVEAIQDSRIAVVVFSKNYASSSRCLNELLEIVKCKDEFGQIVIPVFYGLDLYHVREQTGEFGRIFRKTCKNKTKEVINQWRKALTEVANIHGHHSATRGNEATLIDEIVNDVMVKLLLTQSNGFENFVGIDDHIAQISALLQLESREVRIVGIWCSSGIGKSKTTIARALFNQISQNFQGSIYIDRRFISKSMKIYNKGKPDDYTMKLHLQEIFFSKILGIHGIEIDHVGAVRAKLKDMKVLIFIDDLDNQVVFDTLVGGYEWFGPGSRIIVISKDKRFLRAHGINHIYEAKLPSEELIDISLDLVVTEVVKQLFVISSKAYKFRGIAQKCSTMSEGVQYRKTYRLRGIAQKLGTMIEDVQPNIKEIRYSGIELSEHHQVQLRMLSETLDKCKLLNDKVLKCNRWDMVLQLYHVKKMEDLYKKISSVLRGPLLTQILADVHHLRADAEVRFDWIGRDVDSLNEKLGSMKLRGSEWMEDALKMAEATVATETDGNLGVRLELGKRKVKELLFNLKDEGRLIGISGMSGKTTLAKEIARDEEVRGHFGNRVLFLTVSKWPHFEELRAFVLKFLTGFETGLGATPIGQTRKLVILDDVWTRESLDQLMFKNILGTTTLVVSRSKLADLRYFCFLNVDTDELLVHKECFDYLSPVRSLPSNFRPEILVKLQMQGSKLDKLWDGVQSLTGLKNMGLSRSEYLKELPDLSMAINLEKLDLSYCSSLVELPSSIKHLHKLEDLNMLFCKKIEDSSHRN